MIAVDQLLQPVSPENPSGEDLLASGQLLELETLVMGKPETQFSEAEEPDWRAVEDRCIELLNTSKDLRVAVILAATALRTEGIAGLASGLALVRGLLERQWDTFFPRLDPDDNNDPQERVNVLNNLAAPAGTGGDPLQVIGMLRRVPVTRSREAGNWGLGAIIASRNEEAPAEGENPPPSAAVLEGAFRTTSREELEATLNAVQSALDHLSAIDVHFTQTVVASVTPNLGLLTADFELLRNVISPYLAAPEEAPANGSEGDEPTASRSSRGGAALAGSINSREDVIRALDLVIAYYGRNEPSSPIPFLIERVKRLVPMNFVELIKELTPEALEKFSVLTGPLDSL
jgi:type VI secretion system protein ImpA